MCRARSNRTHTPVFGGVNIRSSVRSKKETPRTLPYARRYFFFAKSDFSEVPSRSASISFFVSFGEAPRPIASWHSSWCAPARTARPGGLGACASAQHLPYTPPTRPYSPTRTRAAGSACGVHTAMSCCGHSGAPPGMGGPSAVWRAGRQDGQDVRDRVLRRVVHPGHIPRLSDSILRAKAPAGAAAATAGPYGRRAPARAGRVAQRARGAARLLA